MNLGIDFGTTNSSVARFDGNKLYRLGIDPANDNPNVLPSLIYIDRTHHAVVGTKAAMEYLFIAYDATAQTLPTWLKTFSPHPMTILVEQLGTERSMRLLTKDFPAGRVPLGGNRAEHQFGELFLNYLVVLQATL